MNIQSEALGRSQVQLTVEVDPNEFERAKKQAARTLSRNVSVPGFRPGKAPYSMVVRAIGEERITEEALNLLVPELLDKAVKETGLQVYSYDDVEIDLASQEPLALRAIFPVLPTVTLGDPGLVSVQPEEVTIEEGRVEEILEELRQSRAIWSPVPGPALYNDRVTLDLRGDLMDGTTAVDEKGVELYLADPNEPRDADDLDDEMADDADADDADDADTEAMAEAADGPNMVEPLIGMMANQVKEFTLSYPAAWPEARLAGRTVLYRATMLDIKREQEAELSDELAQEIGDFETLDALRERIRANLHAEAQDKEFDRVVNAILDGLVDESALEYPEAMVRHRIEERIEQFSQSLRPYNLDFDQYLEVVGKTREEYEDEQRDEAELFIRRSLVLGEYVRQQELTASQAELDQEVDLVLSSYNPLQAATLRTRLLQDPEALSNMESSLLTRKAVYYLYEQVTGLSSPPLFPVDEDADESQGDAALEDEEAAAEIHAEDEEAAAEIHAEDEEAAAEIHAEDEEAGSHAG